MELDANKFKCTEIGVIPSDWEVKKLSDIGKSIIGLTYSPSKVKHDGTLVLRSSNVQDGKLAFDDNVFVEMDIPERVIVKENDLLICVRNGSKHLIGKCALIDKKTAGSAFGAFMSIYRSKYSTFVQHQFQSFVIQRQINETLGATINQITNKDLASFQIPLPPTILEQNAIVTALSDTDSYINSLEKLIAKKRLIKQGAVQKLLAPRQGWVVKKFKEKDVTRLITCGIASTPAYVDEIIGMPFLSSTNVKNGKIQWYNYKHISKELHKQLYGNNPPLKGDILYSRVGTIGEAAIIDVDFEFSIYVSLTLIKTGKLLNNEFLKQLLNSQTYKNLANNTVLMGGGVGNLNVNVVREFPIPIPPMDEQIAIAEILNSMDVEITFLEKKLDKTKQLKQGIMQQLLTGKIRLI
jgi:type I restriction enzyme S subunit